LEKVSAAATNYPMLNCKMQELEIFDLDSASQIASIFMILAFIKPILI
jgi:hypothetical protein